MLERLYGELTFSKVAELMQVVRSKIYVLREAKETRIDGKKIRGPIISTYSTKPVLELTCQSLILMVFASNPIIDYISQQAGLLFD